ncbi:MAG: hypothetical protein ABSB32_14240 [Thermodesulfobacteriota bacterium]|jgi:hypothetical protein
MARQSPKKVGIIPWATVGRHWSFYGNSKKGGSTWANLPFRLNSLGEKSMWRKDQWFVPTFGLLPFHPAGANGRYHGPGSSAF